MRTGRQAEEMTAVAGYPAVRVSTTTRALREAPAVDGLASDLWLKSGRGVRDATIQPHHGVNLAIALIVPPSEGPALVMRLRRLELVSNMERRRADSSPLLDSIAYTEKTSAFTPAESVGRPIIGYLLDAIIFALTGRRRWGDEAIRDLVLKHTPKVRFWLAPSLRAEVIWSGPDGTAEFHDWYMPPTDVLPGLEAPTIEGGFFDRIVEFSPEQFARIAEIVGPDPDFALSSPALPSGKEPESKTAADAPWKASTAILSDQPTKAEPGTSQSHNAGERKKTQPASDSCAGRSRSFDRRVDHDRHQPHGFAA